MNYLEVAFKALDEIKDNDITFEGVKGKRLTLKEDTHSKHTKVNLSDDEQVKQAKEKLDNPINVEKIEKIVDASANSTDELQTNYVGSAILQCPACRTLIYKRPEDLKKANFSEDKMKELGIEPKKDAEGNIIPEIIYNAEEECPHCGAQLGFRVVGQVASLDDNEKEQVKANLEAEREAEEGPKEEPEENKSPVAPEEDLASEDVDDFSESLFDKKINQYIKENKLNLKEYKTKNVFMKDNKIIVEGLTRVNRKLIRTSFILEGKKQNSKITFTCKNRHFTNPILVEGYVYNKKFVSKNVKSLKESWNHPTEEFNRYVELMPSFDDFNKKWNDASQEEKDEMVRPIVIEYIEKYPNTNWDVLFDDLEDNNYHTENKIFHQELKKRNLIECDKSLKEDSKSNNKFDWFITNVTNNWVTFKDLKKHIEAQAKVFKEGSKYGIDNGNVSILWIKKDEEVICNYDRGWDIKPSKEDEDVYKSALEFASNYGYKDLKLESLKENKKPLKEGVGFYCEVSGTLEDIHNVKIINKTKDEKDYTHIEATAEGNLTGIVSASYDYINKVAPGGKVPVTISVKTVFEETPDVKSNANSDEQAIELALEGIYFKTTNVDGGIITINDNDIGWESRYFTEFDFDSLVVTISNERVIEAIDMAVTGIDWVDVYEVKDEEGDIIESFDDEEDAIEFAKSNHGVEVIHMQYHYQLMSDLESEDIVDEYKEGTVWEREYSRVYNYDENLHHKGSRQLNELWDTIKAVYDTEDGKVVIAYNPVKKEYAVGIGYNENTKSWRNGVYGFKNEHEAYGYVEDNYPDYETIKGLYESKKFSKKKSLKEDYSLTINSNNGPTININDKKISIQDGPDKEVEICKVTGSTTIKDDNVDVQVDTGSEAVKEPEITQVDDIVPNEEPKEIEEPKLDKEPIEEPKDDEEPKEKEGKQELQEGTSNFPTRFPHGFPLLVFHTYDEVLEMMPYDNDYPKEEDFESEEDFEKAREKFEDEYFDNVDTCILDEDEINDLKAKLEDFNEESVRQAEEADVNKDGYQEYGDNLNLQDVVLTIEPGYYEAAYIDVENEESLDYLEDGFKEKQIKRFKDFLTQLKKEFGLTELKVAYGPASNGETGYSKVESLKEGKQFVKGFYEKVDEYTIDDVYSEEDAWNYIETNIADEDYSPLTEVIDFNSEENQATIREIHNSYTDITDAKEDSIGSTSTVRELLDMWWNSVRVKGGNIKDGRAILYKDCYDGSYELDEDHNPYGEKILDMKVDVSREWDRDSDGYPIIRAELVEDNNESLKESETNENGLTTIDNRAKKELLLPPYEIEYWETQEDRDQGNGEKYIGYNDFSENDLEATIDCAKEIFYDTISAASVEVLNKNGDLVFGLYDEDDSKDESLKEDNNKKMFVIKNAYKYDIKDDNWEKAKKYLKSQHINMYVADDVEINTEDKSIARHFCRIAGYPLNSISTVSVKDESLNESLRRYAQTDEQEEALGTIENTCKELGINIRFGTSIGKHPQTIILDKDHQGSEVYVYDDGKVEINDKEVDPSNKEMVRKAFNKELDKGLVKDFDWYDEHDQEPYSVYMVYDSEEDRKQGMPHRVDMSTPTIKHDEFLNQDEAIAYAKKVNAYCVEEARGNGGEDGYTIVWTNSNKNEAVVEKIVKKGSQYQVQSKKGRNLGTYKTKKQAVKRLGQVEWFKHHKK